MKAKRPAQIVVIFLLGEIWSLVHSIKLVQLYDCCWWFNVWIETTGKIPAQSSSKNKRQLVCSCAYCACLTQFLWTTFCHCGSLFSQGTVWEWKCEKTLSGREQSNTAVCIVSGKMRASPCPCGTHTAPGACYNSKDRSTEKTYRQRSAWLTESFYLWSLVSHKHSSLYLVYMQLPSLK